MSRCPNLQHTPWGLTSRFGKPFGTGTRGAGPDGRQGSAELTRHHPPHRTRLGSHQHIILMPHTSSSRNGHGSVTRGSDADGQKYAISSDRITEYSTMQTEARFQLFESTEKTKKVRDPPNVWQLQNWPSPSHRRVFN